MSTLSTQRSSLERTSSTSQTKPRKSNTWVVTLTGICFLFGGITAMQLRAVQANAQAKEDTIKQRLVEEKQAANFRAAAIKAERANAASQLQIAQLKEKISKSGNLSTQQAKSLSTQIGSLQMAAGLTAVRGSGIRIVIDDNADAAKAAGDRGGFAPGLVHDFDLQQIVNELRASSAEAISIKGVGQDEGIRVTGYTPIRCVGPVIHVNWQPVTPPFTIEAIGNAKALDKDVNMAGGILKNLGDATTGAALQVKTTQVDGITLPAASGAPRFRVAKPVAPAETSAP